MKDDHLTFEAWDEYWQDRQSSSRLLLRIIPDVTTRVNELIAGNVDFITALNPEQMETITTDISEPLPSQTWRKMHIGIGQEAIEPLKNKLVRQAMNYAVDKQAIVDGLFAGATAPLQSIVNAPQNNPALEPYPYDPEKAKALLAEAGYPDGFKVKLVSSVGVFGNDKDVSQAVAQYLSDVGIETEVVVLENGKFIDDVLRNYNVQDMDYMGWGTYIVLGPTTGHHHLRASRQRNQVLQPGIRCIGEKAIPEEDPAKRQEFSYQGPADPLGGRPVDFPVPVCRSSMGISKGVTWEPHPALYIDVMEFHKR